MKIGGFLKQSFIDFPQTLSAVIFTSGCNFNCWYCHNADLIHNSKTKYDMENVIKFLESRRGFLEGVVISGGEPTLQPDLKEVILRIRRLGYKIKLDTNGSNPKTLQNLLDEKLLDYVAMDIKNSLENYSKTICVKMFPQFLENQIKKSIEILLNSDVNFEFRTTLAPEITLHDIFKISMLVKGCKNFYLQKCNIPEHLIQLKSVCNFPNTFSSTTKSITQNCLDEIVIPCIDHENALQILSQVIPNVYLRGFN